MSNFYVGQKVRVKNFYDIAGTFDSEHRTNGLFFNEQMVDLCGKVLTIERFRQTGYCSQPVVDMLETGWCFVEDWLEPADFDMTCKMSDIFELDADLFDMFAKKICIAKDTIVTDDCYQYHYELQSSETYLVESMYNVTLQVTTNYEKADKDYPYVILYKDLCLDVIDESLLTKLKGVINDA